MINEIKESLKLDIATLGFNTIYDVPKLPNDIKPAECPAICIYIPKVETTNFDEAGIGLSFEIVLIAYYDIPTDVLQNGDPEKQLTEFYEKLVSALGQNSNLYQNDNVREYKINPMALDYVQNKALGFLTIKIN